VPLKDRLIFYGLHGIISQRINHCCENLISCIHQKIPFVETRFLGLHRIVSKLDDVEGRKISPLLGLELGPLAVQPVASHYTNCIIPAPVNLWAP
jgi:hypothetical protein